MQHSAPQRDVTGLPSFRPRRKVVLIDRIAESVITLGGLGVIAAVLGIIAYLLWVVYPLTTPGHVEPAGKVGYESTAAIALIDEYESLLGVAGSDGNLRGVSLGTGGVLGDAVELGAFESHAYSPSTGTLALARADSSIDVGVLRFETRILSGASLPEGVPPITIGAEAALPASIIERLGEDQYRTVALSYTAGDRIEAPTESAPVVAIDAEQFASDKVVAAIRADGTGSVMVLTTRRSLVGAGRGSQVRTLPIDGDLSQPPAWVIILDGGAELALIWPDGRAERFTRQQDTYTRSEAVQLVDAGERITAAQPLLGRNTLLIGTSSGLVRTWMLTRPGTEGDIPRSLVRVKEFARGSEPVSNLSTSHRDRTFIAGDTEGGIALWHATSGKLVGEAKSEDAAQALVISPKLDGFHAVTSGGIASWRLDPGHPTVTLASLFLPVWYEGDQRPSLVYQSTAADDSAEPKLSLTPLIFGTLKATVFALIFAVPIAVMAAIYSSEFLPPRLRSRVKPTVEMMASLPSVVLGFIAAMILAPFVRDHLSAVLVGLVIVPIAVLFASAVWPLLPGNLAWRLPQSVQVGCILLACVLGIALSAVAGPMLDRGLFAPSASERLVMAGHFERVEEMPEWARGKSSFTLDERNVLRAEGLFVMDNAVVRPVGGAESAAIEAEPSPFKVWLNGVVGSPVPGWVALLFVPSLTIAGGLAMGFGRPSAARWLPMARVCAAVAFAIPISLVLARLFTAIGWDARETVLGTFSQRNTFVVGVIMGFAIIPIIFTLSDDAMQSVPRSLRAASLGAGATQWQTAMRIVLPVAASGIFSAVMIGLGRAAGETMIVLMATGNTPVMDWNIFGGLRTLSANIAVELPEADRGGTHYRVLFLCGVVLFAITFVVNTSAEIIRQHFRKRSAML